ncbi:MAG: DNA primase [Clostridiales bacterium]|nr:DNA primase [Clostridiales bacterium]
MYFSEEKISEIIEKNDIVDLISQYLSLNKRGKNFWGLCPFHTEKTPSFSVSGEKQMFYCFGCGTGGNVITFIQKIERLNYVEALYFLAKKARISIDERANKKDLENVKKRELLFNINGTAARFFYNNLIANSKAMDYLSKRGLNKEIIRKFGIGYSLDSWDKLNTYLNSKGFDNNLIENAGLIVKKEKGYYDRFRGRVMFPIINLGGKVIAFGGRVLDDSKPKYLNSPETPIYNKSGSIYALNMIKEISALQNIIIVEGYMDVISLYQFGIKNVVASLGTAFTEQQAKLLKRYTNDIIIAYDSDTAGQSATIKGLSILQKEGCRVKVINLPKGMDPDDFIRKEGVESFNNYINNSLSLVEYRIYNSRKNSDPKILEHRIRFSKNLAMILSTLKSPIEIDAYIKKYSKEMQISEEAIYGELKKIRSKHISGNNRHNIISKFNEKEINGQLIAEKKVLNICVLYKDKAEKIFSIINEDDFSLPLHEKIATIINLKIKEGKTISAGEILIHLTDEEERQKASEVFKTDITGKDIELLDSYIDKLHSHSLENKIKKLTDRMNEYYRLEEKEKANEIFKEILDLQKRKK